MTDIKKKSNIYVEEKIEDISDVTEGEMIDLAELFKMFGDSTRVRILCALLKRDMSVSEICEELNMNQSAISHQLRILKESKLVKAEREGKSMIYSPDDNHVRLIIAMGAAHIRHLENM